MKTLAAPKCWVYVASHSAVIQKKVLLKFDDAISALELQIRDFISYERFEDDLTSLILNIRRFVGTRRMLWLFISLHDRARHKDSVFVHKGL